MVSLSERERDVRSLEPTKQKLGNTGLWRRLLKDEEENIGQPL
jgi:hypothetical protein